jgi:hypothetical protein
VYNRYANSSRSSLASAQRLGTHCGLETMNLGGKLASTSGNTPRKWRQSNANRAGPASKRSHAEPMADVGATKKIHG